MKSFNTKELNPFSSYLVKENTINLTTVEIDRENKGYLVDKKLIDILLSKLVAVDFDTFKKNLLADLSYAENLEELTTKFENGIYIESIIQKIQKIQKRDEGLIGKNELDYSIDD